MSFRSRIETMDLFKQLDLLFNKQPLPEGVEPPHPFVLHRFLASDRDFAPFAKQFNLDIWDPELNWEMWRTLLPRAPGAPRLKYAAPKKAPEAEELTLRIMAVDGLQRVRAEEAVEILTASGHLTEAYDYYGVETESGSKAAAG